MFTRFFLNSGLLPDIFVRPTDAPVLLGGTARIRLETARSELELFIALALAMTAEREGGHQPGSRVPGEFFWAARVQMWLVQNGITRTVLFMEPDTDGRTAAQVRETIQRRWISRLEDWIRVAEIWQREVCRDVRTDYEIAREVLIVLRRLPADLRPRILQMLWRDCTFREEAHRLFADTDVPLARARRLC